MSTIPAELASQLTALVGQHHRHTAAHAERRSEKVVSKTLRDLAKKMKKVARPTGKQFRRDLRSQITAVLEPLLKVEVRAGGPIAKAIVKVANRLATRLVKLRKKQSKQAVKAARWVVPGSGQELLPAEEILHAPVSPKAAASKKAIRPLLTAVSHSGALKANGVDKIA